MDTRTLDDCPSCGKRITDADPGGCETPTGQRYCLDHLPRDVWPEMFDEWQDHRRKVEHEEKVREWVRGIRQLADFVEANPEMHDGGVNALTLWCYVGGTDARDAMAAAARVMAPVEKVVEDYDPSTFRLRKTFGPHELTVFTNRANVCERRVIGTEVVEVEGYSDEDQAKIDAIPKVTRTETRELVEWECSPLLGGEL